MKLRELKTVAYETWSFLHELEDAILQPENFKTEIRRYGDLRCKATWEKAYVALEAATLEYPSLENWQMVQMCFCRPDRAELIDYNNQVLGALLQFPDGLERIKAGLDRLYYQPSEPGDQQDALHLIQRLSELHQVQSWFQESSTIASLATEVRNMMNRG